VNSVATAQEVHMTAHEFLNTFHEIQDLFRWECLEGGAIRGFLSDGSGSLAFDPVTAVLFASTRPEPVETDRMRAARQLGLSALASEALRDASDGTVWIDIDGHRVLDGFAEWLRRGIVKESGVDIDWNATGTETIEAPRSGVPLEPEIALQRF
jgi:hypothetical protein